MTGKTYLLKKPSLFTLSIIVNLTYHSRSDRYEIPQSEQGNLGQEEISTTILSHR